ncbi:hypothetical protein Tco_0998884, partial [Tanacetum coccineum]
MALCTTLQNRVLDLEKTKTTQQNEIDSLKRRVQKLEKKNRSRTHRMKRLYKVGLTARVESSGDEESLGEDASKQGRIDAIDADEEITLVFVTKQKDVVKEANDEVNVVEEVVEVINSAKLIFNDAQVSVAGDKVSTANAATTVSIATITTTDDLTLAQALQELKSTKPKMKGVVIQELAGEELTQENAKKQKVEDDKETTKLKQCLEIIPDKEEVTINAIPLAVKSPSVVGDLKTMFEPHVEDTVWRNQQDYKVLDWKLYDSCGVHSLRMQHVHIHMLVEKKYPLIPSTLTMMLEKKLQIDYESEMAYLGRLVGIKSLLDAVRITAAHVYINTALMKSLEDTANPAYEVSTVSPNINTACPKVSTTNFSDNTVYAFMVENPNGSNLLQQDLE